MRHRHPVDVVDVARVRPLEVLHDRPVELDPAVIRPARVGRILEEDDRDRAVRLLLARSHGGEAHDVRGARDRVHVHLRPPPELAGVRVGLDRELRRREEHQGVHLRRLELRDLRLVVRVVDVVALGRDDQLALHAEAVAQPREEVLAVVVVLVEDADARLRRRLRDVAAVNRSLGAVVRLVADRPRPLLVVLAPGAGAACDEQLGDALSVQVRPRRLVLLGAEAVEDREDVVLLDELARLVDRLAWVVLVVLDEVGDLAVEDAAVGVDVTEVGGRALADSLVGGGDPGERDRPADHDLGRGHPGGARTGAGCAGSERKRGKKPCNKVDGPLHRESMDECTTSLLAASRAAGSALRRLSGAGS